MLEQVVRPFQTPDTINDKQTIVSVVVRAPNARAILAWGAVGKQPPPLPTISIKVKDPDNQWTESSRETTDVRIENPDDKNQYIMTQRIDSITFKQKLKVPETQNSGASGGVSTNTATTSGNYDDGSIPIADDTSSTPIKTDITEVPITDVASETNVQPSTTKSYDKFVLNQPAS